MLIVYFVQYQIITCDFCAKIQSTIPAIKQNRTFCIIEGSEMRGKRHIAQNACISLCGARRLQDKYNYHFCVYVSHAPFCEPTDVSDGAIVSPATFTRSATPYRLTPMFSGLSAAVDGYKIYILYGRRYFNLLINVGI